MSRRGLSLVRVCSVAPSSPSVHPSVVQVARGLNATNDPDFSLYHVPSKTADNNTLPAAHIVASRFWTSDQVGYGNDASVVADGYAYLYGATPSGGLAVARCALRGLMPTLEDKSLYAYYVDGQWQAAIPAKNDSGVTLENTRKAQGTVYFSKKWNVSPWVPALDIIVCRG